MSRSSTNDPSSASKDSGLSKNNYNKLQNLINKGQLKALIIFFCIFSIFLYIYIYIYKKRGSLFILQLAARAAGRLLKDPNLTMQSVDDPKDR